MQFVSDLRTALTSMERAINEFQTKTLANTAADAQQNAQYADMTERIALRTLRVTSRSINATSGPVCPRGTRSSAGDTLA